MQYRSESLLDTAEVQAWADSTVDRFLDTTFNDWLLTRRLIDACSSSFYAWASAAEDAATARRFAVLGVQLWEVMQSRSLQHDIDAPAPERGHVPYYPWCDATIRLFRAAAGDDLLAASSMVSLFTRAMRDTSLAYAGDVVTNATRHVHRLADALNSRRDGLLFWGC